MFLSGIDVLLGRNSFILRLASLLSNGTILSPFKENLIVAYPKQKISARHKIAQRMRVTRPFLSQLAIHPPKTRTEWPFHKPNVMLKMPWKQPELRYARNRRNVFSTWRISMPAIVRPLKYFSSSQKGGGDRARHRNKSTTWHTEVALFESFGIGRYRQSFFMRV